MYMYMYIMYVCVRVHVGSVVATLQSVGAAGFSYGALTGMFATGATTAAKACAALCG